MTLDKMGDWARPPDPAGVRMPSETLTITDNRNGKTYELPITHETIKATDLRQIKTDPAELRAHAVRPVLYEYGVVQEPHHVHRR